jgi:hypothetical protein
LWKLSADAVSPTKWNNDWDGAGLVIDDYLFEGGENSQFHIVQLNRGYDAAGKVTVAPKLVFNTPGWDDQLLKDIGHNNVSIENSVAIVGNTVYFANSGGLVQGWDLSGLKDGARTTRTFASGRRRHRRHDRRRRAGMLYVGSEYEKGSRVQGRRADHEARSVEAGQPVGVEARRPPAHPAGVWGTPALYKDIVVFDTTGGDVYGIDRATGAVRWTIHLPSGQVWQSPVVIDGVLVIGDCLGDPARVRHRRHHEAAAPLWTVSLGGCIESTPAVWKGRLYFGTGPAPFTRLPDRPLLAA